MNSSTVQVSRDPWTRLRCKEIVERQRSLVVLMNCDPESELQLREGTVRLIERNLDQTVG